MKRRVTGDYRVSGADSAKNRTGRQNDDQQTDRQPAGPLYFGLMHKKIRGLSKFDGFAIFYPVYNLQIRNPGKLSGVMRDNSISSVQALRCNLNHNLSPEGEIVSLQPDIFDGMIPVSGELGQTVCSIRRKE